MRIGFRVDASSNIGMGHLIRSKSVADEFVKQGHQVVFLSRSEWVKDSICGSSFEWIELLSEYPTFSSLNALMLDEGDLEGEQSELIEIIEKHRIDALWIDSYVITKSYLKSLKEQVTCLIYVDDNQSGGYEVDILVNGNVSAGQFDYQLPLGAVKLLGASYAMLRHAFSMSPIKQTRHNIQNVLITTGGTDPYDTSLWVLEYLLSLEMTKDWEFHLVIGLGYRPELIKRLSEKQKENHSVVFHENPSNMKALMEMADLAISSGGSTLYELSAVGTPTIAIAIASNQREIVQAMSAVGCVLEGGQGMTLNHSQFGKAIQKMNSCQFRKQMSQKQQQLIDGHGPSRIVETILQYRREKNDVNE